MVLHTTYVLWSTIKLWCCVSFFRSGGKLFLVFCTHLLRVGWKNFFSVVLLCQFFVLAGNMFWFYILLLMYLEYNTVVVLC